MSAYPLMATKLRTSREVRFVPIGDLEERSPYFVEAHSGEFSTTAPTISTSPQGLCIVELVVDGLPADRG